jgi:uncharacterized protein (TIGR02453 family)
MATEFRGFPRAGFDFLRELKENNHRDWFQPRKEIYESEVKAPMTDLVEALNAEFARFAPEYITDPKRAMHRIYRDVRFSKNKDPYKTNSSASFHVSAEDKESMAGYYFSVSPFQIELAAGVYMPQPAQLLAIRTRIAAEFDEWKALVENKARKRIAGEVDGESLTRPPKGFPKGHPADFWIRKKQWLYWDTSLEPELAFHPRIAKEFARRFEAMYPVIQFLNGAMAPKRPNHSAFF